MKKINYSLLLIVIISIISNLLLHSLGIYSLLETKLYDSRFKLRGPLEGWSSKIILVEIDDESYRLIPEPYPYPRGNIWARVLRNLSKAGAKVVVFDIQFDSEDHTSQAIKNSLNKECINCEVLDQDQEFNNSIKESIANGTKVVLASKFGFEQNRIPNNYIVLPTEKLMESNPFTGLVDHEVDIIDNVSRRYSIFNSIPSSPD